MNSQSERLRVAIIGLGYVGTVSAACLGDDGFEVIGVDVSEQKVRSINEGLAPISEPGLSEIVADLHHSKSMSATTEIEDAVKASDIALVCVGTPSDARGALDLSYVKRVCEQLGEAIAKHASNRKYLVVIRSTILPTSMEQIVHPALERSSGLKRNEDFFTAFNPEFLREGTAISDYRKPPKIVVGTDSDHADDLLRALYARVDAKYIRTSIQVAEMVKYTDNAWHATKVTFGNEIGSICGKIGIDSHKVMEIFCEDKQLNISPTYLKPGFAFGGSCLPKDLRAIMHFARHADIDLPMLGAVLPSNQTSIENVFQAIMARNVRSVGLWGLSFKPDTDDLRESPAVILAEKLIGKGVKLTIYDPLVKQSAIVGANRAYIDQNIPHFQDLLVSDLKALDGHDLVVLNHRTKGAKQWLTSRDPSVEVYDLARVVDSDPHASYSGISW